MVNNLLTVHKTEIPSLDWEDPLEKGMATHSGILPGEFHGQRILVGYSPWGHKVLDRTESNTFFHYFFLHKHAYMLSHFSCVQLFVTLWIEAHQVPLAMGFSRKEYWSGLPFPSPGDLPDLGIESNSLVLQADSLLSEPPGKPCIYSYLCINLHVLIHISLVKILFVNFYMI